MPKTSKTLQHNRRDKKPSKKRAPETSQDWLEEGISLEDSGDRWVQDPPKAHRFYLQAIESYEKSLTLDKTKFDAQFNRARLFLQISQACALLAAPRVGVIKQAIVAHRQLLSSYPSSTDTKYNLALVLIYYAELVEEHEVLSSEQAQLEPAITEALSVLRECITAQTEELARINDTSQQEDTLTQSITQNNGSQLDAEEMDVDVTYISHDVLLDSLISAIEAFTHLLQVESISRDVQAAAEAYIRQEVMPQMEALLPNCQAEDAKSRCVEVKHDLQLSLLESSAQKHRISLEIYKSSLEQLISDSSATMTVGIACANADACISLANAYKSSDLDQLSTWQILTTGASPQITKAIDMMAKIAGKAPAMYITKADIELLRASVKTDVAVRNRATLLKNATVYYKRAVAECLPKDIRLLNEATLKMTIVQGELSPTETPAVPQISKEEASQIVIEARADGLFDGPWRLLDST